MSSSQEDDDFEDVQCDNDEDDNSMERVAYNPRISESCTSDSSLQETISKPQKQESFLSDDSLDDKSSAPNVSYGYPLKRKSTYSDSSNTGSPTKSNQRESFCSDDWGDEPKYKMFKQESYASSSYPERRESTNSDNSYSEHPIASFNQQSFSSHTSRDEKPRTFVPNSFYPAKTDDTYAEYPVAAFKQNSVDTKPRKIVQLTAFSNSSNDSSAKPSAQGPPPGMDNIAYKMLLNSGWTPGTGLGAVGQGRVEPVSESAQQGRRGLGFGDGEDYVAPEIVWSEGMDSASSDADAIVDWLPRGQRGSVVACEELTDWIQMGRRSNTLEGECSFCEPDVLRDVLQCKTIFDNMGDKEMLIARTRSNPFETIASGFFMNRAAMKMANMDAITNSLFTGCVSNEHMLYFADICAGPGGFTEYMLWRRPLKSRGFGFTLRGACDFRMADMLAGPGECFTPYYGPDDDGDIFREINLEKFKEYVMARSGEGVHCVLADGGFSVKDNENIQEILSKQLYLCQFLCAINILREGGHFVCKLFDIFTQFSVGLIYLISTVFEDIALIKPVTSRPANSERYIVCRSLIKGEMLDNLLVHLFSVNELLNRERDSGEDVVELVPMFILQEDQQFFNYITNSNDQMGKAQAIALAKIKAFAEDRNLIEPRQVDIRTECLEKWKVPNIKRIKICYPLWKQGNIAFKLVNEDERRIIKKPDVSALRPIVPFTADDVKRSSFILKNYSAVLVGRDKPLDVESGVRSGEPVIVYSKGGFDVDYLNEEKKWTPVASVAGGLIMCLPPSTMLWGSFVTEFCPPKGVRKFHSFHIIDAVCIYGEDLRMKPYFRRRMKVGLMIDALKDPDRDHKCMLRLATEIDFTSLRDIVSKLQLKKTKVCRDEYPMYVHEEDGRYFYPSKIVMTKHILDPYMIAYSRSSKMNYFYNTSTKTSVFELPSDAIAPFDKCITHIIPWRSIATKKDESIVDHQCLIELLDKKQP